MPDEGNTIGDMLDRDFGSPDLPFDWSPDSDEVYRHGANGEERTLAFDLLWEYLDEYPPIYLDENHDPVVEAILDDTDHEYRVDYDDETRSTGVTGIALFAYMDADATVEVGGTQ